MLDSAFYCVSSLKASDIAEIIGTSIAGDLADRLISSVSDASTAGASDLAFVEKAVQVSNLVAGVCFVPLNSAADQSDANDSILIETRFPRGAFSKIAPKLAQPIWGWHDQKPLHPDAQLEEGVMIANGVSIAAGARIGSGTKIESGTSIGAGVTIGRDSYIGANCSIAFAKLGDGVVVQPGSCIGQAGFGLSPSETGMIDTPHFGRVIIQDNVSIGANCCVDRGLFDDTYIGQSVKLDNACHVAHNVYIGAHTVIAGQSGIAGSAKIGEGVMMGGNAGVADHTRIGDGAQLGGNAATMKDIPAGEIWGGFPAKPIRSWFREVAWLAKQASAKNDK